MDPTPLEKFLASFRHAGQGLRFALEQRNLRVHLAAMLLVLIVSAVLRLTYMEWLFIVLAIGLVLVAEVLNTGLEALGDAVSLEHHPLIGKAKDLGAAAVLLASITAAVLGGIIFGRHVLLLLAANQ